jgi:hypothetical protein
LSDVKGRTWTGRRKPNTGLAWAVIAIGTGLLAVTVFQVFYWDVSVNPWFLALVILGMLAYGAITFTSSVEMVVELGEEELSYTKREWSVGRVIREHTSTVERSAMSKVVERNAGFGVRVVRFEDAHGRRLLVFPEFLSPDEHDGMMEAIMEWGNQTPPSSPGSDETPLPVSR